MIHRLLLQLLLLLLLLLRLRLRLLPSRKPAPLLLLPEMRRGTHNHRIIGQQLTARKAISQEVCASMNDERT